MYKKPFVSLFSARATAPLTPFILKYSLHSPIIPCFFIFARPLALYLLFHCSSPAASFPHFPFSRALCSRLYALYPYVPQPSFLRFYFHLSSTCLFASFIFLAFRSPFLCLYFYFSFVLPFVCHYSVFTFILPLSYFSSIFYRRAR